MTPKGSFHGSKRLTWVTSGLNLDADPPQQTARDAGVELEVLGALRVDGRRDDLHALDRNIGWGKAAEREDRRVVALEVGLQKVPDLEVGLGGVNVAAPDPPRRPLAVQPEQGQGLGVVDYHEVILLFEQLCVAGGVGEVGLLFGRCQFAWGSLQSVVDRLGDREEGLIASDQLPVGQDTEVAQQGDLGSEDLGDPAAVGSGVDVENPRAL
jgi:hypothetical protein